MPEIEAAVAVPNPNPALVLVRLKGFACKIQISVYTAAELLVGRMQTAACGPQAWCQVPLGSGWAAGLSNGTYFIQVTAFRQDGSQSRPVIVKVYLSR